MKKMKAALICAVVVLAGAAANAAQPESILEQFGQLIDRAAQGQTVTSPQELEALFQHVAADPALKDIAAAEMFAVLDLSFTELDQSCHGQAGCQAALRAAHARCRAAAGGAAVNDPRKVDCKPAARAGNSAQEQLDNFIACSVKGDASATPQALTGLMKQVVSSRDFIKDIKAVYGLYVTVDRNFDVLNKACQGQPECQAALRVGYQWSLNQRLALQQSNPSVFGGLTQFGAFGTKLNFIKAMKSAGGNYKLEASAWRDLGDCVTQLCGGGLICRLKAYVVVSRAKEAWYGSSSSTATPDTSHRDPDMEIWGR